MAHTNSMAMGAISTAMFGPLVITYAVPPRAVVCFPPCESQHTATGPCLVLLRGIPPQAMNTYPCLHQRPLATRSVSDSNRCSCVIACWKEPS